jgi:asparagine synthase (glutamine-hydrolysing)
MCGIAGFVSNRSMVPERPQELAARMCGSLSHRGPDDHGIWTSPAANVTLAHRRLSVIDLSPLGRNPMSWGNGRLWITFNGEIYNYRELRGELASQGCEFRTQTDTEVVLAAYDRWGLSAVDRLAGMFAFALWDEPQQRLWLARDRLGKKPLYYSDINGELVFASELKAILAHNAAAREVDPSAVDLYLRLGYIPSPFSIYKTVRKLPPAHHLTWERGQSSVHRYWDPVMFALSPARLALEAGERELDERLAVAVRQRLIADVPLGGFLSGGIDSSLIVALMREQSQAPVRTFTIRFENPEYNEADYAAAVARHLGTEHHEQSCTNREMLDIVDRLPDMFDEPFADSSAVPTFLVSRVARRFATVALSGDGGDELFMGYPRHRYHAMGSALLAMPRSMRRVAAYASDRLPTRRLRRIGDVLRSNDRDSYSRFITWWTPEAVIELTGRPPVDSPAYADVRLRAGSLDARSLAALLDLVSYLPEDILTKVDRASMAVSLEVRAPLLDHRVVEFVLSLPPAFKHRGRTTKWLLRRLLSRRVPEQLINRPKRGFGVPLHDWFRGPLRDRMDDYCAGGELEDLGINPRPVRRLWQDFKRGQAHRADLLWHMFALIAWARRFRTAPALSLARLP